MIYSLGTQIPQIDPMAWIASSATLLGDVHIGAESSLWYGSVVRGDVHSIRIGSQTNIQDLSLIHVT
ncbi:MAG TPA: gamma carbonic anhydrase family protein, partial [Turneriella sp.]|nr:gamma carbonic anhydrase family protein [Turneriella sp.]